MTKYQLACQKGFSSMELARREHNVQRVKAWKSHALGQELNHKFIDKKKFWSYRKLKHLVSCMNAINIRLGLGESWEGYRAPSHAQQRCQCAPSMRKKAFFLYAAFFSWWADMSDCDLNPTNQHSLTEQNALQQKNRSQLIMARVAVRNVHTLL